MGRTPCCCNAEGLRKGAWTPDEDHKLIAYIHEHGHGGWRTLPQKAGLQRCGKSCRLRWTNYLRPDIKRGEFTSDEEQKIIQFHATLGNRWSTIARHLPRRTDNEIKNYWNTHIKKGLMEMGINPVTHKPISSNDAANSSLSSPSSASAQLLNKLATQLTPLPSPSVGELKPNQHCGPSLLPEGDDCSYGDKNVTTVARPVSTSAILLNKMASRVNALRSMLIRSTEGDNCIRNSTYMSSTTSEMLRPVLASDENGSDVVRLDDPFDVDKDLLKELHGISSNLIESDGGFPSTNMDDSCKIDTNV